MQRESVLHRVVESWRFEESNCALALDVAERLESLRSFSCQIRQCFYKITLHWSDGAIGCCPHTSISDLTFLVRAESCPPRNSPSMDNSLSELGRSMPTTSFNLRDST